MRDEPARDAIERVTGRPVDTENARDAVRECFCGAAWCRTNGCPTFTICNAKADAVLAALGIPPTTTTSEISAGLWFLAHAGSVDVSQRQGGTWVARDRDRYSIRGVGASPAAAIHALAAKLAEAQR